MPTHKHKAVYNMSMIALFVAIIVVCSFVSVPFGAVPITLQTFAVVCASALLGLKRGSLAVGVYILLGCIGLPVFHSFQGGVGVLLGSTGGYILSFLFYPLIIGMVVKMRGFTTRNLLVSSLLATLLSYVLGTLWFVLAFSDKQGIIAVLLTCVLPFILPDILKIAVAVAVAKRIKKFVL